MENTLVVRTVDDRGSYRRDENYPNLIFLGSVLRWAAQGTHIVSSTTNGVTEHFNLDTAATISNNSRALDSTAAFLADLIESKCVSIYSKYSRLPLGNTERVLVLGKLRNMDGGELGGLIGDDGFGYYLDGRELFIAVMSSSLPVEDDFQKGGVWHRLAWDAPPEWRDSISGKGKATNLLNCEPNAISGTPESNEQTDTVTQSEKTPTTGPAWYDIEQETGCRRMILENWEKIALKSGGNFNGAQALRHFKIEYGKDADLPKLKTIQNRLKELRNEKLIP